MKTNSISNTVQKPQARKVSFYAECGYIALNSDLKSKESNG